MNLLITGNSSPLSCAIRTHFELKKYTVFAPNRIDLSVHSEISITQFLQQNHIDLLVYLAAININGLIFQTSIKDWKSQLDINLHGAYRTLKAWFQQTHVTHKHAILISSYSAIHPHLGQAAYSTTKAAIIGLMQGLLLEYEYQNKYRINTILPGLFHSSMLNNNNITINHSLTHIGPFIEMLHLQMPHSNGNIYNLDSRII